MIDWNRVSLGGYEELLAVVRDLEQRLAVVERELAERDGIDAVVTYDGLTGVSIAADEMAAGGPQWM